LRGIEWIDRICPGLGDQFESEFYNALERDKQEPHFFAANHTGDRPCRLKRFTSVLYFRIDEDIIVVVGLFTSGEDESALKNRG
jgi:hypothetical protein